MKNSDSTSDIVIKENYLNKSNCIQSYPGNEDEGCLSESIGLYMEYLLEEDDKKDFAKQVTVLERHFIHKENSNIFIRWNLEEDNSVNAIIDDVRIINALKNGSEQFNKRKYDKLANNLIASLDQSKKAGIYVDFYDWKHDESAPQITLSYITKKLGDTLPESEKTIDVLKNVDTDNTFFSENYAVEEKKYSMQEEVHMVDQLLIAINRHAFGFESPNFEAWVKEEWKSDVLYGRYDRKSLKPTVDYQSLSVYYYLNRYFTALNEDELALEVATHANQVINKENLEEVHFFDYIQNRKMKQAMGIEE